MLRFSFLLLAGTAFAQQYTISTVAGGAPPATPAAALNTAIGKPRKLALSGGNLYFSSGHSVFKIDGSGSMTLVAGNSRAGFSGDGGPAVNAQLNIPQGIAVDSAGNVYIADSVNNRVRKVDTKGIITTFAGNGLVSVPGFWGDSGPATDANIHLPTSLAIDSTGKVYIAASADNTVRVVGTDGIINIFAGAGYRGYYGDFAAGETNGGVTTGANPGTATIAGLTNPQDISIGPKGALLIADTGNAVIRSVDSKGVITTVSGNGSVGISGDDVATTLAMVSPFGVAPDSSGNLFIAELGSNRIRKVDTAGKITTAVGNGNQGFAGDGGPGDKVEMALPTSVVVDGSGNVYFADSLNNRIRKLSGGTVTTYAGNGGVSRSGDGNAATAAQLYAPLGVAVDSVSLYVADTGNHTVRRVANGVITNFAGTGSAGNAGDGNGATGAQLNGPQGLAVDSAGSVYIADTQNNKVRKVQNGVITTVAGSGTAGFAGDGAAAGSAQLNAPFGVAVDAAGNLYIAEFSNNRVRKVGANGNISTLAGNGISGFGGDGGQAASAMLNGPQSVAVDSAGNVFIADTANNRIRRVATNGVITTVAGNGSAGFSGDGGLGTSAQVGNPVAVAVDSTGNVYIADGSARVRKLFVSGVISTIAGSATRGYSGDGGVGASALLNGPSALAVNNVGSVWVADTNNNSVRLLQFAAGGSTAINAVTNGASNLNGPVAAGEVVAIYGSGLGPAQLAQYQPGADGKVPTNVGGTSVYVNGVAAPVIYSSANQVGAVIPFGISGSLAQMYVQYQNATSTPFNLSVASQIPAIFTLNGSGAGQAAAINNKDGGINGSARPAKVGDFIQLYITGAGQTTPAGADGQINALPLPVPVGAVKVTIGGQNATVNFAGGAPGSVAGVIQVNAQIPTGITVGNAVPVVVQVATSNSQPGVTIAISQ